MIRHIVMWKFRPGTETEQTENSDSTTYPRQRIYSTFVQRSALDNPPCAFGCKIRKVRERDAEVEKAATVIH